jgi:hypothetical protein
MFNNANCVFKAICIFISLLHNLKENVQGDFESCADILITSYWLHVELGKNV